MQGVGEHEDVKGVEVLGRGPRCLYHLVSPLPEDLRGDGAGGRVVSSRCFRAGSVRARQGNALSIVVVFGCLV